MPRTPWYIDWFNSPFYYKLYANRNDLEATGFVTNLVHFLKPSAQSRILDVACGQGRHSKALAAMGYDVTGTDISQFAISQAKEFEKENLQFFVHDMRLPFWINYFDYVFNFFTSFGYFRTKREHEDAISTMCNSLKVNGILVIDYLNVRYSENRSARDEVKKVNGTIFKINRWNNETHFFKRVIIQDPSLPEQLEITEEVAKLMPEDFKKMLRGRGMHVEKMFGDYRLNGYDREKSPRMIILARKIST
ncbi:MAG: class I SAM-dependent methyltransferase [Chitinophagaceae bacterium]|jgi:SAM-dependent methyltransferase|nr:class I SAM-dependent methyltransferase [Chitinophagaceae bacterium]OQY94822.1 MAG: methyltransferase type 11 [Sphingobacteriales bacterium UTBCD1]